MADSPRTDLLRAYFADEVRAAGSAWGRGDPTSAWSALERAHILSQSRVKLHLAAHWEMFKLAWRTRDLRELCGQFLRLLLAGPGSALGRAPLGNTGRSSVSAFAPMPIPAALREKLLAAGVELPAADGRGAIDRASG